MLISLVTSVSRKICEEYNDKSGHGAQIIWVAWKTIEFRQWRRSRRGRRMSAWAWARSFSMPVTHFYCFLTFRFINFTKYNYKMLSMWYHGSWYHILTQCIIVCDTPDGITDHWFASWLAHLQRKGRKPLMEAPVSLLFQCSRLSSFCLISRRLETRESSANWEKQTILRFNSIDFSSSAFIVFLKNFLAAVCMWFEDFSEHQKRGNLYDFFCNTFFPLLTKLSMSDVPARRRSRCSRGQGGQRTAVRAIRLPIRPRHNGQRADRTPGSECWELENW